MKWGPVHPTERGWQLRPRGPAGRVRRGARDARPRPHARLAPPARRLADAGAHPARGGARSRLPHRDPRRDATRDASRRGTSSTRRSPTAAASATPASSAPAGEDYVAEAFRRAHAADPGARLYYNDYGADGRGRKADAVYALVRRLLDAGVPVHGVGLQMHLRATHPPTPAAITARTWRGSRRSASRSGSRRWTSGSAGSAAGSLRPPAARVRRRDRRLRGDAGLRGGDVLGRERHPLLGSRASSARTPRCSSIGTTRRSPPTSACAPPWRPVADPCGTWSPCLRSPPASGGARRRRARGRGRARASDSDHGLEPARPARRHRDAARRRGGAHQGRHAEDRGGAGRRPRAQRPAGGRLASRPRAAGRVGGRQGLPPEQGHPGAGGAGHQRRRAVGGDAAAHARRRLSLLRGLREARAQVPAPPGGGRRRTTPSWCTRCPIPRSTSSRPRRPRSRAPCAPTSSSRRRSS